MNDPVLAVVQQRSKWNNVKRDLIIYGAQGGSDSMAKEAVKRFKSRREREYMMDEDDMSFMEPIFMNRQLPFPEYLVECGYHQMTREIMEGQIAALPPNPPTHSGLDGLETPLQGILRKYGMHFMAVYKIPRKDGGEHRVSVISGKMFYSRIYAPYEISGPSMGEEHADHDRYDPLGYQTDEDLMLYLAKLIAGA